MKKKKKGLKYWITKVDNYFHRYIRLRDTNDEGYGNCYTCNVPLDFKRTQAGHFINRSLKATRWDERNVGVQCFGCNISRSGEQYKFSQYLGNNLSEQLHIKSKQIVKFADIDLIELIEHYTDKVNSL